MAENYPSFTRLVQYELAQGRSVVVADNEHMSALPRLIIGNPALLKAVAKSGGTLILEGPQNENSLIENYNKGALGEEDLRDAFSYGYHSNDPKEAANFNRASSNIIINAKTAHTRIFFPEKETVYDALKRDPEGTAVFDKMRGELTSTNCLPFQFGPIFNALTPAEQKAFLRILPLLENRASEQENQKISDLIKTKPGPYMVLYGDAHNAEIKKDLNAIGISIQRSEKSGYQGIIEDIPEYVYYADTDHLLHIPPGSRERAEFVAKLTVTTVPQGNKTLALGKPLKIDEAEACFNALPDNVKENTLHPPRHPQPPQHYGKGPYR